MLLLEPLLFTLIKCFGIITLGYAAGRFQWVKSAETKGLTSFATQFALPSLIFLNLATLHLEDVNWNFAFAVLSGKAVIFVLVLGTALWAQKEKNLSMVGLYAIFCTQGNDFALAYPVVSAIFSTKHPAYSGYMYVLAPISLLIMNPIGFALMEFEKSRLSANPKAAIRCRWAKTIFVVLEGILKNPNVSVTLIGALWNVCFQGYVPQPMEKTLQLLSNAFAGSVLFLLGIAVSAKTALTKNLDLLVSSSLILTKMFLSPLVLMVCVRLWCSNDQNVEDLSSYGFIYGMVPTGPIVLLFASQYSLPHKMLASSLVICTFLFGPLAYVTVHMLTLTDTTSTLISKYLNVASTCTISLSIIILVVSLTALHCNGKWKKPLHSILYFLFLSQALSGLAVMLRMNLPLDEYFWLSVSVLSVGVFGTCSHECISVLLPVCIFLGMRPSKKITHRTIICIIGVIYGFSSIAVLCTVVIKLRFQSSLDTTLSKTGWMTGSSEALVLVAAQFAGFVASTYVLIVYCKEYVLPSTDQISAGEPNESHIVNPEKVPDESLEIVSFKNGSFPAVLRRGDTSISMKELLQDQDGDSEKVTEFFSIDTARPSVVLFFLFWLGLVKVAGIILNVWAVFIKFPSGLEMTLEILFTLIYYIQGPVFFFIFSLGMKRKMVFGFSWFMDKCRRSNSTESSHRYFGKDILGLCDHFLLFHAAKCVQDLTKDKGSKVVLPTARGKDIVRWLVHQKITPDNDQALAYGERLLIGGVLTSTETYKTFNDGLYEIKSLRSECIET